MVLRGKGTVRGKVRGLRLESRSTLALCKMRPDEAMESAEDYVDIKQLPELRILKRLRDSGQCKGFVWKYEHDFR